MNTTNESIFKISKSTLRGKVFLSGAKNSVLRLLAASILTSETVSISNYPSKLADAIVHVEMLRALGKLCNVTEDSIVINESGVINTDLIWSGRSIRNTLLILGALVARSGFGAVPLPGGCNLGDRKYDLHELVLQKLGAEVWIDNGKLCASSDNGLVGSDIHLPLRSTGATENAIIASCLARGTTRIWNPHIRPEIIDLISFLNKMGAKINVFGQQHIEIEGVDGLSGTSFRVMPDNMEAITWLVASVMTGGDLEIYDFPYKDLEVPLIHLRESGAKFYKGEDSLIVRGGQCYPLDISTGPYPGINSDVQPILAAYASCARGESTIVDLRFPGRYDYAKELAKMGVVYKIEGNLLRICGNCGSLQGSTVKALDLRAGIALALCGLVANEVTSIEDSWQIERGYNNFIFKLKSLGANVEL